MTHVTQGANLVGDRGASELGEGLKVNSSLEILNLVSELSECTAVVLCVCIVTLGLQSTGEVGDAGACSLGDGLKVNSSLQELHLVSDLFLFFVFVLFLL